MSAAAAEPSGATGSAGHWRELAAPAWAVFGVSALFASASYRLGERGVAVIRDGLGSWEWMTLAGLTIVFVYGEGFLALDRKWVPGLMRRARELRDERRLVLRLLAPLYGLSLIGAPPAKLVSSWLGTLAIVGAILVVRAVPDPWRGIIDFAVAAALAWGLVAILRRLPTAVDDCRVRATAPSERELQASEASPSRASEGL